MLGADNGNVGARFRGEDEAAKLGAGEDWTIGAEVTEVVIEPNWTEFGGLKFSVLTAATGTRTGAAGLRAFCLTAGSAGGS